MPGPWGVAGQSGAAQQPVLSMQALPTPLLLLVLAPLLEETALRWGLHEGLLRHGVQAGQAVLVVALVFAALHVVAWGQVAGAWTLLPALGVGWAYARWQRLWVCVALHAGLNGVWLAGLALGFDPLWLGLRAAA
jgi:membrane protease YdiL (CAAX protease family)